MSRENVELVRRAFLEGPEAFWALLDEHVVADARETPGLVDLPSVLVGRDAVIEGTRHYWGTWTDYRADLEELIDAGPSVVVVAHEQARGKGSGVPYELRVAEVLTFHRGKVIRWELFRDKAEALEAAGFQE
jgi:ketosteroid isomerase-like protein